MLRVIDRVGHFSWKDDVIPMRRPWTRYINHSDEKNACNTIKTLSSRFERKHILSKYHSITLQISVFITDSWVDCWTANVILPQLTKRVLRICLRLKVNMSSQMKFHFGKYRDFSDFIRSPQVCITMSLSSSSSSSHFAVVFVLFPVLVLVPNFLIHWHHRRKKCTWFWARRKRNKKE